jgi:hypothetical protein
LRDGSTETLVKTTRPIVNPGCVFPFSSFLLVALPPTLSLATRTDYPGNEQRLHHRHPRRRLRSRLLYRLRLLCVRLLDCHRQRHRSAEGRGCYRSGGVQHNYAPRWKCRDAFEDYSTHRQPGVSFVVYAFLSPSSSPEEAYLMLRLDRTTAASRSAPSMARTSPYLRPLPPLTVPPLRPPVLRSSAIRPALRSSARPH